MATFFSQHVRHLGYFKKFILHKTEANVTEISRGQVFAEIRTNLLQNLTFSI